MRAVIYTHDLEPITAVNLSAWVLAHLRQHGRVRLEVLEPVSPAPYLEKGPVYEERKVVALESVWLRRPNGVEAPLLLTSNEAEALLLQSVFLPGQWRAVHEAEARAFAKGVRWMIERIGDE